MCMCERESESLDIKCGTKKISNDLRSENIPDEMAPMLLVSKCQMWMEMGGAGG